MKKIIFFSDCHQTPDSIDIEYDKNAFLLDYSNFEKFLKSRESQTVYTSLDDLPDDLNQVWQILDSADTIHYCPSKKYTTENYSESFYESTDGFHGLVEFLMISMSYYKPVSGLEKINDRPWTMKIKNRRKDNNPCLFTAGCSNTAGVGVNLNETYGYLIAKSLNLHHVQLAFSGTSLTWQADQLLRSDIRKDDIVIWGLTNSMRFTGYTEKKIVKLNGLTLKDPSVPKIVPAWYVLGEDNLHKNIAFVETVTNFCEKVGAKLYMFETIPAADPALRKITLNNSRFFNVAPPPKFDKKKGFVQIEYIDLGSDNCHPGKKQHQIWHDSLLEIISNECAAFDI